MKSLASFYSILLFLITTTPNFASAGGKAATACEAALTSTVLEEITHLIQQRDEAYKYDDLPRGRVYEPMIAAKIAEARRAHVDLSSLKALLAEHAQEAQRSREQRKAESETATDEENGLLPWTVTSKIPIDKKNSYNKMEFSSDGKRLLLSGAAFVLKIFDVESGQEISTFDKYKVQITMGHGVDVVSCHLSPDGSIVAMRVPKIGIVFWDANSGNELGVIASSSQDAEFLPDGKTVLIGPTVYDTRSRQPLYPLENAPTDVGSSEFRLSPTGQYAYFVPALSMSSARKFHAWEASSGRHLYEADWPQFSSGMKPIFTADQSPLAGVASYGHVQILDVRLGTSRPQLEQLSTKMSFNSAGDKLLTKGMTGDVWHTQSGAHLYKLEGHDKDGIIALVTGEFSQDGKYVLAASYNRLVVYSAADGSILHSLERPNISNGDAHFSPDGQTIASRSSELSSSGINDFIMIWKHPAIGEVVP